MPSPALQEPETAVDTRERLSLAILGHVDHGKSTLVGRLLHDTDSLAKERIAEIRAASEKRGATFEWSFLTDALQAERDQNVTMASAQFPLKTPNRDYMLVDAPGHSEFMESIISGTAGCDAALILVDTTGGVPFEALQRARLLQFLGITQFAVLIAKMDMVDYSQARFNELSQEYQERLKQSGIVPMAVIPVSAREGDNITAPSPRMPWYQGPTVLSALAAFASLPSQDTLPLRFAVQDVYKSDAKRIVVGRVESGRISVGDDLLFSPTNRRARIATMEEWNVGTSPVSAGAGESIGFTLAEPIFVERGHLASHIQNAPVLTNRFHARIFWFGHRPLVADKLYTLRHLTAEYIAEITDITEPAQSEPHSPESLASRGQIIQADLRIKGLAAVDAFSDNMRAGRFVLIEEGVICGGGVLDLDGIADQRLKAQAVRSKNITAVDPGITHDARARLNGHTGGVLWLTGLSGAGKSTMAVALQERLFARGCQCYLLDSDNIRQGLNKDLGFSVTDRSENVRRAGEVAALFADAGMIVIVAFISPYHADRQRARAATPDHFHLVHLDASLSICESRDPKGLYKKARKGEIQEFTGISAPYEVPGDPDLILDTSAQSVEESATRLMEYAVRQFIAPVTDGI